MSMTHWFRARSELLAELTEARGEAVIEAQKRAQAQGDASHIAEQLREEKKAHDATKRVLAVLQSEIEAGLDIFRPPAPRTASQELQREKARADVLERRLNELQKQMAAADRR